jgi:hypothetical protein
VTSQTGDDFQQTASFRSEAYAFAYADTPQLAAILEEMRATIPTMNTEGRRQNIRAEQIHEKDMRGSIYAALLGNKSLLTGGTNLVIIQAACQTYLDTLIYAGI